jgi:hypothetical protein
MKKRKVGRPTKLNKQLIEIICEAVEQGCTITAAAAAAGVYKNTLTVWSDKGERDIAAGKKTTIYAQFHTRYRHSREIALAVLTKRVYEASFEEWRAAAWMLERRDPDNWGKQTQVKAQHTGLMDIVVNIGKPPGEGNS